MIYKLNQEGFLPVTVKWFILEQESCFMVIYCQAQGRAYNTTNL